MLFGNNHLEDMNKLINNENNNDNEETLFASNLKEVIDTTLASCGISQERFIEWFSLKECNCTKRKAWLNSLFSWKKNLPQG
jgi:hypothetical protein